ncbi:uncharacterized protein LY89DRAFT_690565 [Mollisia scopiformis]|uniref:Uncharacterized protein n=1 Tax=Mollisia scopiformis TaxID=149040 RepID=A0A132B9D0_MOLSC|nr:uncharacterized protein LY89DRAFT_690565 [Mollisia scopiformis]KUJ09012.1 hypothetical protein LY89DRAFT_690565 [Mollisia scopiformis]
MANTSRSRRLRTPPRATRAKAAISYAEGSSDSELEAYFDAVASDHDESPVTPRPRNTRASQARRTPAPRKHKRNRTSYSEYTDRTSTPKRIRTARQSKPSSPKPATSSTIEFLKGSGVVPEWQNLPYHVFVRIFQYAAYPLYDEHTFQPQPSLQWLVKIAPLCRSFGEAVAEVLYKSPPLVPMGQAHGLMYLLQEDPSTHIYDYRKKIKSLQIDVGQVVAYSLPGSGHLDLFDLIKNLPQLKSLEFYHQLDMSPYRDLDSTIKWNYSDRIFKALEYFDTAANAVQGEKGSVCYLKSWRWSSRLAGKKFPIETLAAEHLKPYFQFLTKIAFVNYQVPGLKKDEEDPKHEAALANAIKALPQVKHLIFESSTLVNAILLPLLPTKLEDLELINCWEVVAEDFAEFLVTHGRCLRSLTLNHNQSLNLGFLPILGEACPNLEVLHMNLTYFNLHATYRDSEPQYEKLLLPDQVPVWPSTLRSIELIQLRKWEMEAAEMFFQSLLDSAATLPDLRKLTIQAIINIPWRTRASFRDTWLGSLDRVFKRVSKPPLPVFTLQAPTSTEEALAGPSDDGEESGKQVSKHSLRPSSSKSDDLLSAVDTRPMLAPPRRSLEAHQISHTRRSTRTRLATGTYAETSDSEPEPEPFKPTVSARETSRHNRLARELEILKQTAGSDSPLVSTSAATSDSDSDAPLVKNKGKGMQKEVIQGMCDIVEVRIDNLRPTENQVTEADFLDEERSGDEDWDGQDGDEDGYAW